jgi:hypothetical protein
MKTEVLNGQTQKPNFYYCRHMQPGTCRYDSEMILVDTDAIKHMGATGPGIPVFIHHQPNVPINEIKDKACGYVTESFYNELDGWLWFKFMAIDDECRLAVSNGWAVSNAYRPLQWGAPGTKNNVPYDREIMAAEFTHLAIVPNPRYEDAKIFTPDEFKLYQEAQKAKLAEFQNSKPTPVILKGFSMFKFLKRKNEEVTNAADATHVELEDGKVVTVAEAAQIMNGKRMKKNEGDEQSVTDEDKENEMFDLDGEKLPLKALKNAYRKMNAMEKKNAEDEAKRKEDEEKKNAEDEAKKKADEKANAEEEEKKKKDEAERTNGKGYFDQLLNAAGAANPNEVVTIETTGSMMQRGQSRYGSAAK